jgi:C-terminal processing protease CtpA/Prc
LLNEFRRTALLIAAVLSIAASLPAIAQQQQQHKIDSLDLGKVQDMLHAAYNDVKKNYYDPQYHGIDIDARYREYNSRLSSAVSLNEGMRVVAAYLDGFKDSHLFFIPPMRPYTIESGFRMEMVGDQCLIDRVRPGTDAADKLYPGDRILSLNSFKVTRTDMWTVGYYFNVLNPAVDYDLNLQSPDGTMRRVGVKSFIKQKPKTIDLTNPGQDYWDLIRQGDYEDHVTRSILKTEGDVTYWKMPEFNLGIDEVEGDFSRVKKHSALVLDLRGNPGGAIETLKLMVGSVFDHDVKIADRVGRKDSKPMIAKKFGTPFTGKIVVLIDDRSASCAELFARILQLEHRGTVIGDQSSGSVMEARRFEETSGTDTVVPFGFSITDANLIMSDGKSLEKTGVTPDEVVLPTPEDLAAGRDPVLARAATLAGGSLSPEQAGKMFPVEWLPLR